MINFFLTGIWKLEKKHKKQKLVTFFPSFYTNERFLCIFTIIFKKKCECKMLDLNLGQSILYQDVDSWYKIGRYIPILSQTKKAL